MRTFITFLLVLAFIVGFFPLDSLGQEIFEGLQIQRAEKTTLSDIDNNKVLPPIPFGPKAIVTSTTIGGNWSSTGTWVGGVVPTATDDVVIDGPVTANGGFGTNRQCNNLTVNASKTLTTASGTRLVVWANITNNGTMIFDAGSTTYYTYLFFSGNITNNPGATITATANYTTLLIYGTANQNFVNNGTVTSSVFALQNQNPTTCTLSGSNQIICARVNAMQGTFINANKLTMGTGTTASIQRGVTSPTVPAGAFDVNPTFNVSSTGLALVYSTGTVAYSTGPEVPAILSVGSVNLYDVCDVTLSTDLTITSSLQFWTVTPIFRIGANTLTLNCPITYTVTVPIYGSSSSNLIMNFATTLRGVTNGLNNLTINNNINLTTNAVTVYGTLYLSTGIFTNSTFLTMGNNATINRSAGSLSAAPTFGSSVNVIYSGSSSTSTSYEIPTTAGVLNNLTTNTGGVIQSTNSYSSVVDIINESFETSVPPNGWSQTGTGWVRAIGDNGAGFVTGTNSGSYNAFIPHSSTSDLKTSVFDCSNGSPATYSFWYANARFDRNSSPDVLTVSVSNNGGSTWTTLMQTTNRHNSWTQESGSLEGLITLTNNMMLKFARSGGVNNSPGVCVDDVYITKTSASSIATTITVNGLLNLTSGTFNIGANNLVLNGSVSGSNAIVGGTSSNLTVSGAGINLTLPSITNGLHDFTINRSNGITLGGNVSVMGTLSLTNGPLDITGRVLTIGSNSTNIGNISRTGGVIISGATGLLTRYVSTTPGTYLFPVGTLSLYNAATVTFTGANLTFPSNNGTLSARFITPTNSNNTSTLTDAGNYILDSYGTRGFWEITPANITTFGNYNLNLEMDGFDGIGANFNEIRIIKRTTNSGSLWTVTEGTHDPATITTAKRIGFAAFSQFALGGNVSRGNPLGNGGLPVTLSSFTYSPRGRNVLLDWVTATEINNEGFNVERILSSELRIQHWEKIGYVSGHGTVNTPTNYSFEDRNLQTGKYKYRLKQIDFNGNFEYFALNGEVEVGVPNKFNLSQNYPNPFNPTTKIDFDLPFDSKVNIVLYDMTGREVKTMVNEARTAGYYTVQFNASDLSSGMYFYRITADKFVMTKKMMLVK